MSIESFISLIIFRIFILYSPLDFCLFPVARLYSSSLLHLPAIPYGSSLPCVVHHYFYFTLLLIIIFIVSLSLAFVSLFGGLDSFRVISYLLLLSLQGLAGPGPIFMLISHLEFSIPTGSINSNFTSTRNRGLGSWFFLFVFFKNFTCVGPKQTAGILIALLTQWTEQLCTLLMDKKDF